MISFTVRRPRFDHFVDNRLVACVEADVHIVRPYMQSHSLLLNKGKWRLLPKEVKRVRMRRN